MQIEFVSSKLKKTFESPKELTKQYGSEMSKVIQRRMAILQAANILADVPSTPPPRRHLLTGDRKGQFAVDLKQPFRLIFEPLTPETDPANIQAIRILGVEDYH